MAKRGVKKGVKALNKTGTKKQKIVGPKFSSGDVGAQPLDWMKLLSLSRMPGQDRKKLIYGTINDHRTEHERDFDRVVFCTPVRRLKDKTQVFPLDMHDGVRTRLTHSMEVSNLARSMGTAVAANIEALASIPGAQRNVPALLAAIALTHDLGNPPFGHQGEVAIRSWVESNEAEIKKEAKSEFNRDFLKDFLLFEGNAQGFRLLTRLQHQDHKSGLRLTASTLRAFMKYPWLSGAVNSDGGPKKFGVFRSEKTIFEWASAETGLEVGVRHPLSYLMEVCDDIAYSVLDIEDAVKKELVSVAELASFIGNDERFKNDVRVEHLLQQYNDDRDWLNSLRMPREDRVKVALSSKEIRDSQVDIIRSYAIGLMVSDAIDRFMALETTNAFGTLKKGIAEDFRSSRLVDAFKCFAVLRVYNHPSVLKAELQGHNIIPELMTVFWRSIVKHRHGTQSKIDEYVMSLMSPNYVRVYRQSEDLGLPCWYRQVQLVCDQVCGMTDSYAIRVHCDLRGLGAL
ncbi:dNTP triphosphohydrolase [Lysobacter sp. BMK333-48F3]|uniref:dGTP triphosphohydrolase n=1 Tax=Lysobacter sp. BMK333-48F3 TaxID=2867962 RepID=UPI001C8BDEA0|nr:dNTP triphosphohydrolase [Lysobacter sp. BMK333-48F3]MBX9402699.1 dNTP triphosphohydrolase [Lysobacter sp. BMK333-48F3]